MFLLVSGLLIWLLSLHTIDFDRMTDIGIASVLPAATWLGIALTALSFPMALRSGRELLVALSVIGTILALHGLAPLAEPTMRFVVAWRHVGIADHIATYGSVDPGIDAYFNWPGFFVLTAFLSEVAGLHNAEPIARYAPLAYNLMYLPPLIVIGRTVCENRLTAWIGIWLFYVSNWIGQDYFSPQGLYFFVFLVVLGVLLRWFQAGPAQPWLRFVPSGSIRERGERISAPIWPDAPATPVQRMVLVGAILIVSAAMVASHQLTPFALVLATGSLVSVGLCRLRSLPLIILAFTLLWMMTMAVTYLSGHLHEVTGQVGAVNDSVSSNVGGRLQGSPGHAAVVHMRLATTALLWTLAAIGTLRRVRAGRPVLAPLALAMAAFPLFVVQPYGGEVLLRIGLFAAPFMALLAAFVVLPSGEQRLTWPRLGVLTLVGSAFVATFPITRLGNERSEYFSPADVAATRALYRIAPQGSVLVAATDALPWRSTDYASDTYRTLTDGPPLQLIRTLLTRTDDRPPDLSSNDRNRLIRTLALRMSGKPGQRSYLILTRSQKADVRLFGPWRPNVLGDLENILMSSSQFRVLYRNRDAMIFKLVGLEKT